MTSTPPTRSHPDGTDKPIRIETGDELDALVAEHDLVLVDFYRRSSPSASGSSPEGEGRTLR